MVNLSEPIIKIFLQNNEVRQMEKQYVTPQMEITEFLTEDVITTSSYEPHEGQGGYED